MGAVSFLLHELAERLVKADGLDARWQLFCDTLARIGSDQINYGVFDTSAAIGTDDVPVRFLSTMRGDWIDYYSERRMDLADPHVGDDAGDAQASGGSYSR